VGASIRPTILRSWSKRSPGLPRNYVDNTAWLLSAELFAAIRCPERQRRQIKVRVHQPNLAVRARDGYVRSSSASPVK